MENIPRAVRRSKLESDTKIEGERDLEVISTETVNKSNARDEVPGGSRERDK